MSARVLSQLDSHRRNVRNLMIIQVVGGVGIGTALSVGALLAADLTGSDALAGTSVTAITLGAALFAVPLSSLSARRSRRAGLSCGWTLAVIGAVIIVVAGSTRLFPLLLAGMLIYGGGQAANLQARFAAADFAEGSGRARSVSMVLWSTAGGLILGSNLSGLGGALGESVGLPRLVGPFMIAAVLTAAADVLSLILLPGTAESERVMRLMDEVVAPPTPGAAAVATAVKGDTTRLSIASIFRIIADNPPVRFAFVAIVAGQGVMVALMTMSPIYMKQHGATLTLVGISISVHVLGMYGFSPLVGMLADRIGHIQVIVLGQGLFLASAVVGGASGGEFTAMVPALLLLGLGWSCGMVAASALLSESVERSLAPRVQGITDLSMNVVGAAGAALSGTVFAVVGFAGLSIVGGMLVIPTLLLCDSAAKALHQRAPLLLGTEIH